MTYTQILNELEGVGLKEQFQTLFESLTRPTLLEKIKATDKIHGVGSLLRALIDLLGHTETEERECGIQVRHYFITPKFARHNLELPKPPYPNENN
jgi:hypothetical protein